MRFSAPLMLIAIASSVAAQTTVYSNAAPRAAATIIAGSNAGAPSLRYWGGWATDGTSMFNFGGRGVSSSGGALSTYYNGLDAYNPTTNTWTNLSADGNPAAPGNRFRPGFAYDPVGNRLVMFGGSPAPGVATSECWSFDLGTNTWSQIPNPTPGTTGPSDRFDATMAFDAATNSLILFGGDGPTSGPGDRLGDTWQLNGTMWTQLSPTTSPSARALHTMTARAGSHNDIALFGGRNQANTNENNLWRWDGANTTWVEIIAANATTPVTWGSGNGMVYDEVRDVLTIIGGPGTNVAPSNTTSAGGWTSEFDCVTNEWRAYGNSTTSQSADDPVWGNTQRFCVAYLNGKTYFWAGQNVPFLGDAGLPFVKEYQADPVASTASYGAGCAGQSGSALTLTANSDPWTIRTWTGTCTNLAASEVALHVWGFATSNLQLDTVLPFALPGCFLLNTADVIPTISLPSAGAVDIGLTLANDPAIAGMQLHAQVVALDFGNSTLASSNGLTLTIGAL